MGDSHFDLDSPIRMAAFEQVKKLSAVYTHIPAGEIRKGFSFEGKRIPLVNPQRGIFRPKEMKFLLSIRTVFPKTSARVRYEDQIDIHRKIFENLESIDYAFMGTNPDAADNKRLREAYENRTPVIYFLGIAPGQYQAIAPVFIGDWDGISLRAKILFGRPDRKEMVPPKTSEDRRYALHIVKQRVHQGQFRESILIAYKGRCALSGIPERRLLDAAHIIPDADPELGQPVISNGLLLSKIHHAAFDSHLIGIDPDYGLHVSKRLLDQNDGPTLQALKRLDGNKLRLPKLEEHYPDKDRLAMRYKEFKAMG